jgi:cell division protein FtsB
MQKRLFFVPAAVIIFILYFTVFGDRGLLRINHLHRDLDDSQKRLGDLKEENDKLKREIAALQSDRRYLESIARRDFGLVRGNEVIYQFPPAAGKPVAPQGGTPVRGTVEAAGKAAPNGAAPGPPAGKAAGK